MCRVRAGAAPSCPSTRRLGQVRFRVGLSSKLASSVQYFKASIFQYFIHDMVSMSV